jgi:ribonuclease E
MPGKLIIDARYKDETRMAIIDENNRLENFEIEHSCKRPIKGNIYLAKIIRIEPSIQAAFIDYGAAKHGFLPLSEIHYEYFNKNHFNSPTPNNEQQNENEKGSSVVNHRVLQKHVKIQEVISTNQIVLVQAEKECRGNKCAFFTTFVSLPGRYCVLIPNSQKNKNTSVSKRLEASEKERLREIVDSLEIPEGMGCIVRTACAECNKQEIKRDLDYLFRLWNEIKAKRQISTAPTIIYEEGNIVKRSIRDLYRRSMDEILIHGIEAYKEARTFMRLFTPSHVRQIKLYNDNHVPLFRKYDIEEKMKEILNPVVPLPSGGSIVIDGTEALTAIDVNSGRSKSERDINGTAFKTNLEAATEIARQLKLRDIAGIIVIDFIDMTDSQSICKIERKMKEAMKQDYSNVQIGKISQFGLLELSRQRLRPSISDTSFVKCKHCSGAGKILSIEVVALSVIRQIEGFLMTNHAKSIVVEVPDKVDLHILNHKRNTLSEVEKNYDAFVEIARNDELDNTNCNIIVKELRQEQSESDLPENNNEASQGKTQNGDHESVCGQIDTRKEKSESVASENAEAKVEKKKQNRRRRTRPTVTQGRNNEPTISAETPPIDTSEQQQATHQNSTPSQKRTGNRKKFDKDGWLKKLFG